MRGNRVSIGLTAALAIFAVTLLVTGTAISQKKVLHSFGNGTDGAYPRATMIMDAAGNFYGTTGGGGIHACGGVPNNCGTVFELSPQEGGGWTETVLHSFGSGTDGYLPFASLVRDATGNLYGTTLWGGTHNLGTAFELSPNGSGGWTEKVLHSFGNGTDGAWPYGGLILDTAGDLYGTANTGGIHGGGAVFELTPNGSGGWSEKLLHSFGNTGDGTFPYAGLARDAAGNFYGTTLEGGIHDGGTVFELTSSGGGSWTERVLHSFAYNGPDGTGPYSGLIIDTEGNLYGTTYFGGIHPCPDNLTCGAVFELTPNGGGSWTEKVLHSFSDNGADGSYPWAGLTIDGAGNLYGTTVYGGIHNYGAMFKLTPAGGGRWTETVLHSFNFDGTDPAYPYAGLIFDAHGNLYGTSLAGGAYITGTVFEFTP